MKAYMLVLLLLPWMTSAAFQTAANFTDNYSAVFRIEDDPVTGATESVMKVTLTYINPPIQLEANGGMWLGIGLGRNTMLGSDLIICQWNDTSGKTRCSDHQAAGGTYPTRVPPEDPQQNVWAVYGYKADNRVELTFKRYLSTGDASDFVMRRGATVNLVWAFGFPDRLYHGLKNRGAQVVMFD